MNDETIREDNISLETYLKHAHTVVLIVVEEDYITQDEFTSYLGDLSIGGIIFGYLLGKGYSYENIIESTTFFEGAIFSEEGVEILDSMFNRVLH